MPPDSQELCRNTSLLPLHARYQGLVRVASPPRHVPRLGPDSENDMVVDGVRILGQRYEVQHVVGEGAYGLVMKCRVVGGGGGDDRHVAIKSFKIEVGRHRRERQEAWAFSG